MKGVEVIISMPKFSIAFIAPAKVSTLKHRIVEGQDQDSALKSFFSEEASEFYSDDDQGFFYFKEDFFDETNPSGSVVRCE
jgi:guanylate kinase